MIRNRTQLALLALAYTALLVYGTWFPLSDWDWSRGGPGALLALEWPAHSPRSDVILNLIVYMPLGLLLGLLLGGAAPRRVVLATLTGAALSLLLEFGQTFLPGRTSSLADLALNTTGTVLGALAAAAMSQVPLLHGLAAQLQASLREPGLGRLGLCALVLWALSQWLPFVPSLDLGNLRAGLAPLKATLVGGEALSGVRFTSYALMLLGVGAVALATLRPARGRAGWLALAMLGVLLIKVPLLGRVLSSEALLAAICMLPLLLLLQRFPPARLRLLGLLALAAFYSHGVLQPALADTSLRSMNWVLLRGHIHSVHGLANLLETIWVFVALAFVLSPRRPRGRSFWLLQGLGLLIVVFALEWYQQYVPGRHADITDVLVALAAWAMASRWRWGDSATTTAPAAPARAARPVAGRNYRREVLLALALVSALVVAARFLAGSTDDYSPYNLPDIDSLAAPELPGFRYGHPRLPAPDQADIELIEQFNPAFWERHRRAAANGELYSRILMARVEPGAVDLARLHRDLLALQFTGRGQQQTKPLAVAYDWLHASWTDSQRRQLRQRLEQACDYQIDTIRNRLALSPYNVYLYNSPLQALMMAAVASHGDGADDRCMRFTADYWRNRVLPVWRQVMGDNGGWHEGGEYVGIGIGQAIYQLPALWRQATGEDLFQGESGIRGFLDFAIYRTRPDGTHMRLGDASFFNRSIPDLAALAIEYQHKPAYTLAQPPTRPAPTAWPWGPLSQASLHDPEAREQLPTSRFFDGIGLLIARSDWSPDASWVSFKAGDNYWSHMHLDQGAFTLFKGGALAIDSGLYGPRSQSDHHLNYSYQSIAHNLVTVTDPADTVPMPPRRAGEQPRPIANDGGQRRVGSGWGRVAPLDYLHWVQQQEDYSTVDRRLQGATRDYVWMVADLTPAYRNRRSGQGDFSARSRRVESYQRSFIYNRRHDIVVVYDRVRGTEPRFRKKWLLHSLREPQIRDSHFRIATPPDPDKSMAGGVLQGQVLLPASAAVEKIGGPGFEFFVDGVNYDQDGAVQAAIARKQDIEAGAWRLEVQPGIADELHEFLVVMTLDLQGEERDPPGITMDVEADAITLLLAGEEPLRLTIPRSLRAVEFPHP
ncbi:VanZ family protein [Kineobactrum salinum]|uniref:DUF4962 domain-containing protein n=1 Tax=Kineobactrum salinum TaxID=2708301 RepID=A0A6C0TY91_9GAMM|nr:VanZ family protein [Kineobactrum salinum]QIB64736.1 DUF4962 domain-containing protein [Kineobactrum salinum]